MPPKKPKQSKAAALAAEEATIRQDIDQAFAIAQENDLFRLARNESGIESVLFSILRGNAVGRGGVHLPDEKQFKNWLSAEDAMYVINYAKKKGWLKQPLVPEGKKMKTVKLTEDILRHLIKEVEQDTLEKSPSDAPNPDAETAGLLAKNFVSLLTSTQVGEDFQQTASEFFDHALSDDAFYPSRIEDTEPMSKSIAKLVAQQLSSDPRFNEWLATAVASAFRRAR